MVDKNYSFNKIYKNNKQNIEIWFFRFAIKYLPKPPNYSNEIYKKEKSIIRFSVIYFF